VSNASVLRLGLVQHACGDDLEANLERSVAGIREAAALGAGLVLLPELHRSRYFCQTAETRLFDLAEPIPGPTSRQLAALAEELRVVIVGSIFEHRGLGLYHNTALVFERDGRMVGRYRKMHIPDDPGYYEKFYFTPGDTGFHPIDTSVGRLGVLVCWDQWFPEAARLMTLAGAEVLLYPTAIGWDPRDEAEEQTRQREAWWTVQRGHAVANGVFVAACNRVGLEPDPSGSSEGAQFWGSSFVAGPQGEWLWQAGAEEAVAVVDLPRARLEAVRRIWPFLRDRRIDAYGDLGLRWRD